MKRDTLGEVANKIADKGLRAAWSVYLLGGSLFTGVYFLPPKAWLWRMHPQPPGPSRS